MITAIVLVQTDSNQMPETAQAIADLEGVTEVYSCVGDGNVDIVAIIRVTNREQLADVIDDRLSKSHGILNSNIYIVSRRYSRADIEAGFGIGFSNGA